MSTKPRRTTRPSVVSAAGAPDAAMETPEANRDVVASVSYRADGTHDQQPGFRVIGQDDEQA